MKTNHMWVLCFLFCLWIPEVWSLVTAHRYHGGEEGQTLERQRKRLSTWQSTSETGHYHTGDAQTTGRTPALRRSTREAKTNTTEFFIYLMPLPGEDKLICGIYRKLYCRVYLHRAEAQAGQRAYQKRLQNADLRAGRRQGKELRMRQHLQRLRDWTHTHTHK